MKQFSLFALSALLVIIISLVKLPLNLQHFFIVGILLFAISRLLKDTAFFEKEIVLIFIATLFFYLIFLLIYSFMPPIWLSAQMLTKFLSKNIASLIAKKALFGAATIDLPVTVLFVIFILIYHIRSRARSKKLLILGLISILIAQALSIPTQILMVNFFKKLNASIFITPMDFIFVTFLFGMIPIYFFTKHAELICADAQAKTVNSKYYITALIFLFVSLILLTLQDIQLPRHTKNDLPLQQRRGQLE
jgi:hypothetical protein